MLGTRPTGDALQLLMKLGTWCYMMLRLRLIMGIRKPSTAAYDWLLFAIVYQVRRSTIARSKQIDSPRLC